MRTAICYVYPFIGSDHYLNLALRFLKTYHSHPAGYPHDSFVMCNGGAPNDEVRFMFGGLENVRVVHSDNCGRDCSAFQQAAWENPDYEMMVFFGASTYIKGAGWLARMVQAREKHGDTLYGTTANRGHPAIGVHAHIRTTGWWLSPALLNAYPLRVSDPSHRYPMEHGPDCVTSWVKRKGLTPWLVTWDGEYQERAWDSPKNGYHQGSQSNLIVGDRMTEPPYHHCP